MEQDHLKLSPGCCSSFISGPALFWISSSLKTTVCFWTVLSEWVKAQFDFYCLLFLYKQSKMSWWFSSWPLYLFFVQPILIPHWSKLITGFSRVATSFGIMTFLDAHFEALIDLLVSKHSIPVITTTLTSLELSFKSLPRLFV